MDKTAIQEIGQLAVTANDKRRITSDNGLPAFLLDEGQHVVTLETLRTSRVRFRGTFKTSSLTDFAEYVNKNADEDANLFVNHETGEATIYLNMGSEDMPGHCDWAAHIKLRPTAAYAAVRAVNGKALSQKDVVAWCEDWAANLAAELDGGTIALSAALLAVRNLQVNASKSSTHVDRDMSASRTTLEAIEAKAAGADKMPSHFLFTCNPYPDFTARTFRLRLGVINNGDKPSFVLRVIALEAEEESIGQEFKTLLRAKVTDGTSLTLGTFSP